MLRNAEMLSIAESGSTLFFNIFEFSRKKWIKVDFLITFLISNSQFPSPYGKVSFCLNIIDKSQNLCCIIIALTFQKLSKLFAIHRESFSLQVSVLSSSVFFENDALALTAKMSVDNMKDSSSRKKSFAAMTVNTDREVKIVGLGSLLQVLLRLPMLLPIAIWRKPRIYDFTAFVEYKRKGSWN